MQTEKYTAHMVKKINSKINIMFYYVHKTVSKTQHLSLVRQQENLYQSEQNVCWGGKYKSVLKNMLINV